MTAARPSPELLEALLALAQVACLYQDGSGGWVASPVLCAGMGYSPGWVALSMQQMLDKIHSDDVEVLKAAMQGQAPAAAPLRLRHQNGQWQWFKVRSETSGAGVLLIFSDISEAKQMEAALLDSQMRLHSVYNAAPVAIILWSKEGRITDWNRTAQTMLGHTHEEVLYSKLVPRLIAPADYTVFSENINRLMQTQTSTPVVCRTLTRSGATLHCEWRNVILRNVRGGLVGLMSLVNDVTAEMAAEASLRKSVEVAEELSRSKSQFIALASHELRTPLNGILGMAQILENSPLGDDEQMFVQELVASAGQMKSIIDGIMEYASADALSEPLHIEQISLLELVAPLTETYALQAKARGLEFVCELGDADSAFTCYSDLRKLTKILRVLLDNAVKFTDAGSVTFRAKVVDQAHGDLCFEIADTGVGIPEAFMEYLYIPFKQAACHTVRRQGGLGVGLAMARKLVDALGGRLDVSSQPGSGTTFTLRLHCAQSG